MDARPHRRRQLWAGSLIAVLVVAGAVWWASPSRLLPGGDEDGGASGIGVAPGVGIAGTAPGSQASEGPEARPSTIPSPVRPAPGSSPTTTPGARPSPSGAPAAGMLRVDYTITTRGLLSYTAKVTISNPTTQALSWEVVTVRLSGLNLAVTPSGDSVSHTSRASDQCFYSTVRSATVPGDGSVAFTFTVTALVGGILGDIRQLELGGEACARTT